MPVSNKMNLGIKLRLALLGSAVGLMGLLIVAVVLNLQHQANDGRARLARVDSESFRIAEHFKDRLREVNDKMRQYGMNEHPELWQDFVKTSEDFKSWITAQAPLLTSDREKQLLTQMEGAYLDYAEKAKQLHSQIIADTKVGVSLAEYNNFYGSSRRLFDLGQELARAHYDARNHLLAKADLALARMRTSVLALLALLFLFGLALALSVYRNLIFPLRTKLLESQDLVERQEKLASLGMVAAGVAHEIRNPLTAIKTALFTQQRKLVAGSPAHSDASLIEREILRLEHIVNNFLQFARPARPEVAQVPAQGPLTEVQSLLSPELAKSRIQLICEESEPLSVRADAAQIKQVLINLVQNAADSIGQAGTITMRARLAKKRLRNGEADGVVLEVSDTGKGIAPEVQRRLCDPFFTTKDNGTGLGLAIAARLVEMNGGALQYQTQLNRGTTFGIVLPLA
jgi:signal transduction histidine kinase